LESKEEVSKAQKKLEATIRRALDSRAVRTIGYPGGKTLGL